MNSKNYNERFLNAIQRILSDYEGKVIELKGLESSSACNPGDNFMSEITKITAFCKFGNQRYNLILKKQLSNKTRRKLFRCDLAFINEIIAYNVVIPELEKYLHVSYFPKRVYAGNGFVPKDEDWIVLEDLSIKGFQMMNKTQGIDYNQTLSVMKMLGAFHSASISVRIRTAKIYKRIKRFCLTEIMFDGTKSNESVFENAVNTAINVLKEKENSYFIQKSLIFLQNMKNGRLYNQMMNYINDTSEDWAIISHGDLWTNNLLFKQTSAGMDVKVVDLQTLRCCSPVIDMLHLMYSSVMFELRNTHLDDFLREYHDSFINNLELNLKKDFREEYNILRKTFTLDGLKDEYHSKKLFGIGIALWLLPMITCDTLPDMNVETFDEVSMSEVLTPEYERRLSQILQEFL